MTLQDRANAAVVGKLDQALAHLQSELDDIGVSAIDLSSAGDQLVQIIRNKFAGHADDSAEGTLHEFGAEEEKIPMPLIRSFACYALRSWLNDLEKMVKQLEEAEDAKLDHWVKRTFGKGAKVDFWSLRVMEGKEKDEIAKWMSTIYQVLHYESGRIEKIVAGIGPDANGLAAFVRDLGKARLADARVAQVLTNLLEVEDHKVIDEVVDSPELKIHAEYKAIRFMGDLLKKRLAVGLKDEDWRFLGDDEKDAA